jgi:hypothetical protein
MKRPLVCLLLAAGLTVMPPAWAQTDLQEGLWEISISMTIGGQPASAQPLVMRQCISQQSAQEVMSQLAGAGTCATADVQFEGNQASWTMTCSSPVEIEATGTATFGSDSFDGVMSGQLGMSGQRMPFSQSFQAHRVGACQ